MINLNETPEQIMMVRAGVHVLVDGREMIVATAGFDNVYLTNVDAQPIPSEFFLRADNNYSDYCVHVRRMDGDKYGVAVMRRSEMCERLINHTYVIG